MNNIKITILSFYSFLELAELEVLKQNLLLIAKKKYLKGTVLISKEGFNGTISGEESKVLYFLQELKKLTKAEDVNVKVNYHSSHPFDRLKVKIKNEAVTMGVKSIQAPSSGIYIEPKDWDSFITREDVVLIDTRNHYEVELGTFEGSVNPNTKTFREFPEWVQKNKQLFASKKIAMCCTGGVRCEKSTAYMKSLGFKEVYHLKGGILQYLQDTNNQSKLWRGACFVFDNRRAVGDDLQPIAYLEE